MTNITEKLLLFGATALIGATVAFADNDVDISVNGDFRGTTLGAATAPGWSADTLPGTTRIIQGSDWDEFAIEITAPAGNAKTVCSDYFPVLGNILKLEVTLRGTGTASVGFAAFDAARQPLVKSGMSQTCQVSAVGGETKNYFTITDPQAKFIRLCLTANPGSQVSFGDVDAEYRQGAVPAAAPAVVPTPAAAPAARVLPPAVPVQPAAPVSLPPLIDDRFYSLKSIGATEYQVTLPVGSEIDFKLEEDADNGQYWSLSTYDAHICRVKMEHDRDGIWPFRYDNAEIELKGLTPGTSRIVFNYPGKTFVVHVTVR
ncbi:MAG: hypothetical protein HPZ91_14245 [Lentisphaeria bacterium]|nr:hypothetical protein [Lentisphaeria bacterium]